MRYELWARTRDTKVYEFQDSFTDANERYYRIDTVDSELYSEAMVLITDFNKEPRLDLYVELDKRPRNINKEVIIDESIRKYKK